MTEFEIKYGFSFLKLKKKLRLKLSEDQIRQALETAPYLAREEVEMGRSDPLFNITLTTLS